MTLPTGTISMSQVNVELFRSATATINLNESAVRTLAGVPSGTISMNNLRGKTNQFAFTIASNQIDANLRTLAINAGWDGTIPVQATINAGVWISGSVAANSTAALTIDGSFPNGVTLINNGTIAGRGGNGGAGGVSNHTAPLAGTAGGRALLASVGVTIQNNGTIAGGGGGGGGGGGRSASTTCDMGDTSNTGRPGGGGGGGGRSNASYTATGGAGGASSDIGCAITVNGQAGGTGTSSAAGGGGAAGYIDACGCPGSEVSGGAGGGGGDWGTAGSNGGTTTWFGAGGAAGQAVSGNSNITWTAFGTRSGPIV